MNIHPPKWADRFLAWYCNPDLLEEIQGDAHELYYERVEKAGKAYADRKYIFDVLRFFRWSTIRRSPNEQTPGYLGILWNLNFKIALRNAFRNKLTFFVKMAGLSICLAFAVIVSAFVLHEFTFDTYYPDHDQILRIGSEVNIQGTLTNYAVSPVALGEALHDEIPEVESACWLMYHGKPAFDVGGETFNNEITFVASHDFLRIFTFDFLYGTIEALDDPNKIVITETMARKYFKDEEPGGQTIDLDWAQLEVAAVIKDPPANSHLKFDALISWDTFTINDSWGNINAYTYVKLKKGAILPDAIQKINAVLLAHRPEIEEGHGHRAGDDIVIKPIIQKIADIHLGEPLDEDVALKRNKTNLIILTGVIILFIITGLINYLNLSLAELTTNLKKIGILRVFGGGAGSHNKIIVTHTLLGIFIVAPLTAILSYLFLRLAESHFSIFIERVVFLSPAFLGVVTCLITLFVFSSRINSFFLARANDLVNSLKGKFSSRQNGFQVREVLVATQLSFSIIMIALIVIIVDQFRFINTADKGFEDKNTVVIKMESHDFSTAEIFQESLRKITGVKKADATSFYLDNVETKEFFEIDTETGAQKMLVVYMNCGYEYLEAMHIELVKGRNFQRDRSDNKGAYIINETAAKEFGWKNPIGKTISGPLGTDREEGEVIGVVKDFHFASLHNKIGPLIIFSVNEDWGVQYVYVKVNPVHPSDIITRIEKEYKKIYSGMVFEWDYLDAKYKSLYREDDEIRSVFQVGLVVSILVSCLGIFSLSALLVIMREKEMGIRKVVGATELQLFILHMKRFIQFMVLALFIAGPVIYLLASHWLNNFAYHIDLSAWHFIIPGILSLVIIFITSAFHGIKTSHVNPVEILKHE